MPTISTFFGIVVQMYWRDHPPPHIHVFYGDDEALIEIRTGEVLAGRLPRVAMRIVLEWVELRQAELLENWRRAEQKMSLLVVAGADEDS